MLQYYKKKYCTLKCLKMTNYYNLGACTCVTQSLCALHTYNIKRHLPGPEAVLALLPSLLLFLWFALLFHLASLCPLLLLQRVLHAANN